MAWKRIAVHDFVNTHFLKKSGWALHTSGPVGLQEELVLSSKRLAKLFKEGKAALFIDQKTWEKLVAKERGKPEKKVAKLDALRRKRAEEARKKAEEAARLKQEAAKRAEEAERQKRLAEQLKRKVEKAKKAA